ncbi:prepilin-type N-terminal cleavage/methylation domain-containing protein [Patescibacteria group bacterium]
MIQKKKLPLASSCLGFTLIELLMTTAIIGVILSAGLINYQRVNRSQIFHQSVKDILSDLRLVQDKAFSGEKPAGCLPPPDDLFLEKYLFEFSDSQTYQIKAVCNGLAEPVLIKTGLLKGVTRKTSGPDQISFMVLTQGVDLGGAESRAFGFSAYGLTEELIVTQTGELYITSVPTETPVPGPTATPTPTIISTPTDSPLPSSTPTPGESLLFYTTCENIDALLFPEVGSNVSNDAMEPEDFQIGYLDNACDFATNGAGDYWHITNVGTTGNLNGSQGGLEFRFKPDWDHNDNAQHLFFEESGGANSMSFLLLKNDSNQLHFRVNDADSPYISYYVRPENYSWQSGTWNKIRVEWDEAKTPGNDEFQIFINGSEPIHTDDSDNYIAANYDFSGMELYFSALNKLRHCDCLMDEIKIDDGTAVFVPTSTPIPTVTPPVSPTLTLTPTLNPTPTPTPSSFNSCETIEAEFGNISGAWSEGIDGSRVYLEAVGGGYLGEATYQVNIAEEGNYQVKAMVYGSDHASNSVYVTFDDQTEQTWNFGSTFETWLELTYWYRFPLSVGQHTLHLWTRESESRVDWLWVEKEAGC